MVEAMRGRGQVGVWGQKTTTTVQYKYKHKKVSKGTIKRNKAEEQNIKTIARVDTAHR